MEKIEAFYKLADEYCKFIAETEVSNTSVTHLMELIMQLYVSALTLPESEPENGEKPDTASIQQIIVHMEKHISPFYWAIFEPGIPEEPVGRNLCEDLSVIGSDLQRGMLYYEAGQFGNAVFEWKLGLNSRWGNHAVDALRVLHAIRKR